MSEIEFHLSTFFSFQAYGSMEKLWKRIEYDDKEGLAKTNEEAKHEFNPARTDPSVVVDPCCMLLSNLTIDPDNCEIVWTGFVQVSFALLVICETN
jgi:hypothetical protein